MLKKIVFLGLVLVLVTGTLFAGGGSQQKAAASGKTVINIWTHNRHDLTFMQKKVDEYNAKNTDNIEVVLGVYTDNYTQAVDMVFQTGDAPDIFSNNGDVFTNHRPSGRFVDLNTMADDTFRKNFPSEVMINGVNVIDGKCYFIPTMATTNRLFYNKTIFKRLGIAEPKTLEEMIAAARKITSSLKGEGIYGFAQNLKGAQAGLARSLTPMADRELGLHRGFDFAKGEYDYNPYYDILMAWKELVSPDIVFPGSESLDIDPLRSQFAAGKIGMYFSFTHAEPGVYASQFPTTQEWGSAQIPTHGGKIKGAQFYSPTNGYLINAGSKNLNAAWKVYTELLLSLDLLKEYYEAGLGITMVPAVIAMSNPAPIYRDNPTMLITPTDAVWPMTPYEANSTAVVVEGLSDYDTFAAIIWGTLDARKGLADLTERYNKAYRAGIAQKLGKEIRNPNFNPMKPSL